MKYCWFFFSGAMVIGLWAMVTWAGDDFLVNEENYPASFKQSDVVIDHDSSGGFVAAWADGRDGVGSIYVQRYDPNGSPIGGNFRVSNGSKAGSVFTPSLYSLENEDLSPPRSCASESSSGECCQINNNVWFPSIAVDPGGKFVITWSDSRQGQVDVYAQRYDSTGVPQGGKFTVNEVPIPAHASPVVSCSPLGDFVIAWHDKREGNWDIYAQRFSADGTPLGGNFRVNDDDTDATQLYPAVAWLEEDRFVIVWGDDRRNGERDIYAQFYNSDGLSQGANFKVNTANGILYSPSVCSDGEGDFVVAWASGLGNATIHAQIYDANGDTVGENLLVTDGAYFSWSSDGPSASSSTSGTFAVCWSSFDDDVWARRYDPSGIPLDTTAFMVNDDAAEESQYLPFVSCDPPGRLVVAFWDFRLSNWDIYAQRYDAEAEPLGGNFKINDDTIGATQEVPAIDCGSDGSFVVAWSDLRHNQFRDIYAQRYDADSNPLGENFKVNQDDIGWWFPLLVPSLDVSSRGDFVIVWTTTSSGIIYAQRYDENGDPLSTNFRVMDAEGWGGFLPSIDSDTSGNFVICWEDYRNGMRWNIYAQRYNSQGDTLGKNFLVNDSLSIPVMSYQSAVACFPDGGFVIAWRDLREDDYYYDIYAQRFDANGIHQGGNFRVNDDLGNADQSYPSVCCDGWGNFVIVWSDYRQGNGDVYAQRFDSVGTFLGENFRVNDDDADASQNLLAHSVASNSYGDFVICWSDCRNGDWDIYIQQYNREGSPVGANRRGSDDLGHDVQVYPAVSLGSSIHLAWQDNRIPAHGYDIFAKKTGFQGYFVRGDVQADGDINIFDGLHILYWLGGDAQEPLCLKAADIQDDGLVNVFDGLSILYWVGGMGDPPLPPCCAIPGDCGPDPTPDELTCVGFPPCGWSPPSAPPTLACVGSAQESHLAVGESILQEGAIVAPVTLTNAEPLIGFSWAIEYDHELLTAKLVDNTGLVTEGFDLFVGGASEPGVVKVVAVSDREIGDGVERLPSGAHQVARIVFEVKEKPLSRDVAVKVTNSVMAMSHDRALNHCTVDGVIKSMVEVPHEFSLSQNYPNPFNPITEIGYALPKDSQVRLTIYNVLGQKVTTLVDEEQTAGYKTARWDSRSQTRNELSSGIFFYRLQAGDFVETRKMILLR